MQLNPSLEYQNISDWIATLIGKRIKPQKLASRLESHLTRHHPVRVKLHASNDLLDPGDFTIGAEYDSELDERGKKQFIINLIVNHPKHMPMEITGDFADRFALEMLETLVHEYQHQHQYRSRDFILNRDYTSKHKDSKIKEAQEYLGQPDEIDAYAANIAARCYIIEKLDSTDLINSLDLLEYYKTFGPFHPVIKRLMKKIIKNLQYLRENEHGKKCRRTNKKSRIRRL